MAELSVFECGLCSKRYNQSDKLPLSLPCGHVFCKTCMKNLLSTATHCPIDKQKLPLMVESLPCCYAIFNNLPKNKRSIHCARHPKKKVKFLCKTHTKYLCTVCILDHSGPGHEIIAFVPNLEEMHKELQTLLGVSQEFIAEVKENLKSENESKKITSFYDSQVLKVSTSYDNIIKSLSHKKRELIELLKKSLKDQIISLEKNRLKISKKLESAVNLAADLKKVANSLHEISYEDFSSALALKKNELRFIIDLKSLTEAHVKYMVYNESLEVKDLGSISLLKAEGEIKGCCGMEVCQCQAKKQPETVRKCKNCHHPNFRMNDVCFYCKFSGISDFSATHSPGELRIECKGAKVPFSYTTNFDEALRPN